MRRIATFLSLLLCSIAAMAQQSTSESSGYCYVGAVSALIQGLQSSNKLLGVIPSCKVTVYLAGTQNVATIYDSSGSQMSNPFTATTLGYWLFYAGVGVKVDVIGSGGNPPNIYPSPTVLVQGGGGGGGGSSSPRYSVQYAGDNNGAFASDPNITINPFIHQFQIAGAGTGKIGLCGGVLGNCVNLTVDPSTATSTFQFPLAPQPTTGTALNCLTTPYASGTAITSWTGCNGGPFNPSNSATYVSGQMPQTTIKAADYGAVCNLAHDDTAAIQAAASAATRITYFNNQGVFMGPAVVELPQGDCLISSTIVLQDYGSLKGNNTVLTPIDPWVGSNLDMVDLTTTYFGSTTTGNYLDSTSQLGRFISGIKFEYNAGVVSHTAIRVFDPTGSSATTPYPAGALFARYQMPGVSIHDNVFYALDTAIVFQDCGECIARDNQILAVRMGIEDSGNNFGLTLDNNVIQEGSWLFSAPADRTGATTGILEKLEVRWSCSNTAKNCAGGTATQNVTVTPQGLGIIDGNQEAFDNDVNIGNIQGLLFSGGGSDFGGDGPAAAASPSTIYPTILLGANLIEVNMTHYYVASNQTNGVGVQIAAPAGSVGTNPTWNDLTIDNTYFSNYAGSGEGIVFAAGTFPRRGVKLVDNTCQGGHSTCIQVNHPLQYSIISGNYTADLTGSGGALIQLNATGGTSFLGTKIEDNSVSLNPYPVILDTAGGGYTLGTNFSPGGFQGTQSASANGCTISPGAIGNICGTMTTITWPQTFADSSYAINNCGVSSATGAVGVSQINIVNATTINVTEVALSTTATGGGIITCSATHQ